MYICPCYAVKRLSNFFSLPLWPRPLYCTVCTLQVLKPPHLTRDLQSFEIRFEFESAVPILFDSKVMGHSKISESAVPAHCSL